MNLKYAILVLVLLVGVMGGRYGRPKRSSSRSTSTKNLIQNCKSKYADNPIQLQICIDQVEQSKDYHALAAMTTFGVIIVASVLYVKRDALKWRENHVLAMFLNRHSKKPKDIKSDEIFEDLIKPKRKLVMIYDDVQKHSHPLIINAGNKLNNVYWIEIISGDQKGEFKLKGYLKVDANRNGTTEIAFVKEYFGKVRYPIAKDLIFQGEYNEKQFVGDWYFAGCQGKRKLSGKWRTETVRRIDVLFG